MRTLRHRKVKGTCLKSLSWTVPEPNQNPFQTTFSFKGQCVDPPTQWVLNSLTHFLSDLTPRHEYWFQYSLKRLNSKSCKTHLPFILLDSVIGIHSSWATFSLDFPLHYSNIDTTHSHIHIQGTREKNFPPCSSASSHPSFRNALTPRYQLLDSHRMQGWTEWQQKSPWARYKVSSRNNGEWQESTA